MKMVIRLLLFGWLLAIAYPFMLLFGWLFEADKNDGPSCAMYFSRIVIYGVGYAEKKFKEEIVAKLKREDEERAARR